MRVRSVAASGCLLAALAFGVAACGGDDDGGGGGGSEGRTTLTIYSSLPLQGDSRPQSEYGRQRREAGARGGGRQGREVHDQVQEPRRRDRRGRQVGAGPDSANARKAAQDASTIAYLGEFNSGASAISIPILNEAGILQISPSNTYVGLTRAEGADKGEPDKYYPSGKRTYGRVVPADHIQAAAQVAYQKDEGCTKTYILNDKEVYGKGIADQRRRRSARPRACRSSATTASTPRRRTSAPWPRRSSRPAPTACSSAASRRTRASRSSRTSTPPTRREAVRPGRRRRVAVHLEAELRERRRS